MENLLIQLNGLVHFRVFLALFLHDSNNENVQNRFIDSKWSLIIFVINVLAPFFHIISMFMYFLHIDIYWAENHYKYGGEVN